MKKKSSGKNIKQASEQLSNQSSHTESLEQIALNNIIANMPGHVYWKNKEGVYLGCNNRQAKSLGFQSGSDVIGKTDFELPWKKEIASLFRKNDIRVMQSGAAEVVEEKAQVDGKETTVLSQKTPLRNNKEEVIGVLGISIDISDRKKIEEELVLAKENAEAANFIMTELISNMGHDLATPISDIGYIAQIFDCYSNEYPELKEIIDQLSERAAACEKVRKSIIDATSISNLEVKMESFSTVIELLALQKKLAPTIGTKNIQLIIQPFNPKNEDRIETDRKKFHDILFDLISNAINFTEEGQVVISVLKEDDIFHIKVSDTGIGIPANMFEHIFKQYTKLSSSNKHGADFKGVGAGLYLARIRANILHATISVESEVNKGSTFTLSIPTRPTKIPEKNI